MTSSQTNILLSLLAQTSLHPGAGSTVGAIDLPIQRESHNGWPCIYGSSVKGALRDKAEKSKLDKQDLFATFGPDTDNASDHAGAISVGDARLLLLPIRSLTSAFKWVTCPAALKRLKRDSDMLNLKQFSNIEVPDIDGENSALSCSDDGDLFLEEYRFTAIASKEKLSGVIDVLSQLAQRDEFKQELEEQLVIISDDMFSYLVQNATAINAHIALNSDTKTTKKGALWYEETLPPETLMYVPVMAQPSRSQHKLSSQQINQVICTLFSEHSWLRVGGNETLGMGWCAVKTLTVNESTKEEG